MPPKKKTKTEAPAAAPAAAKAPAAGANEDYKPKNILITGGAGFM
jgi:hypothetical protein